MRSDNTKKGLKRVGNRVLQIKQNELNPQDTFVIISHAKNRGCIDDAFGFLSRFRLYRYRTT